MLKLARGFRRSSTIISTNSDDSSDEQSESSHSRAQSEIFEEAHQFERVIEEQDEEKEEARRRMKHGDGRTRTWPLDQIHKASIQDEAESESLESGRQKAVDNKSHTAVHPLCTGPSCICSLIHRDIDSLPPSIPHPQTQTQTSRQEHVIPELPEHGTEQTREMEPLVPPQPALAVPTPSASSTTTDAPSSYFEDMNRTSSPVSAIPEVEEPVPLTDEEKIQIIEDDFGIIVNEGEKEEIVWESDGDIRRGVSILVSLK